jgi:hypothetical protein
VSDDTLTHIRGYPSRDHESVCQRESLLRIHGRYQRAVRPHKTRILDEFCATCGYHRKAALRLLNDPLPTAPSRRSGPKIIYGPAQVWPVQGGVAGQRSAVQQIVAGGAA